MISVAIASYNGATYIIEQLESIRMQSRSVDEVVVCDDCSKDETVQIVQKYIDENGLAPAWKVYKNEKNLGYTRNFYGAIEKCHGDLVFLCDQDDFWYSEKVEAMTAVMESDPERMALASGYDICNSKSEIIDNPGVTNVRSKDDGTITELSFQDFMGASIIRGCTMCFRKKIMENERLFDLSSSLGHDWLINVYACLKGKNGVLNKKLSAYRVHEHNISFQITGKTELRSTKEKRINGIREEVKVLKWLLKSTDLASDYKKTVLKEMSFARLRLSVLEKRNIFMWICGVTKLSDYKRIYGTVKGAIKIYVGDLLYSFK